VNLLLLPADEMIEDEHLAGIMKLSDGTVMMDFPFAIHKHNSLERGSKSFEKTFLCGCFREIHQRRLSAVGISSTAHTSLSK